ncbi:MAG: Lrp/AsnC ligand binding domain-containing protein [Bacteroidales bacterium]|nr:Lrp/AsnC ligand binding domain-containing protein [Bacteroidales bacterium]
MFQKLTIDNIDKKILSYLMNDARISFLSIAKECNISSAAIQQRVKKMTDAGIIKGSKFTINPKVLGYDICAFIGVFLDKAHAYKSVVNELKKINEIVECHYTTGNYAIFLKLYCKNNEHLMKILIDTIQNIEGVSRTETFISLEQTIERQIEV